MQQQLEKGRQEQQQQQAAAGSTAVAEAPRAVEGAFDAMRQAALTMFKQRTKDLTALSQLQEQHHALERQMTKLQGASAELQAHQARVEALTEKEEQQAKERAAELQKLHTVITRLGDEQRALHAVGRTTDRVVAVAGTLFRDGESTGPIARLLKLLEAAQSRTAGRTTGDFRNLSADLRRREALLREYLLEARRTGTVPRALSQAVQDWTQGNWRQHAELAEVLSLSEDVASATRGNNSNASSKCATPAVSPSLVPVGEGPSPREEAPVGYSIAVDEDAPFAETALGEDESQSIAQRTVQPYLSELRSIALEAQRVGAECDALGVVCEAVEAGAVEALEEQWSAWLSRHAAARALLANEKELLSQLAAEVELLSREEHALQLLMEQESDCRRSTEETTARGALLSAELENHYTALQKVSSTRLAQAAALTELETTIQSLQRDTANLQAGVATVQQLTQREAAEYAASIQLGTEAGALAAAALTAAQGRQDDLEKQNLRADERWRDCQARLQLLIDALSSGEDTHKEVEQRAGDAQAASEDAHEDGNSFVRLLALWDGNERESLREALSSLSLDPDQVDFSLSSEAILESLRAMQAAYRREQTRIAQHNEQMKDILQETALLEKELA